MKQSKQSDEGGRVKIFKYELELIDKQTIDLPTNHQVLSVGVQNNKIMLWVKIDPQSPPTRETFYIIGTGNSMPENCSKYSNFIGTVQMPPFVWHVFKEYQG